MDGPLKGCAISSNTFLSLNVSEYLRPSFSSKLFVGYSLLFVLFKYVYFVFNSLSMALYYSIGFCNLIVIPLPFNSAAYSLGC